MSVRNIKELAQQKMVDVVESLAKAACEGDVPSARLLAEIAGSVTKAGAGRPSSKPEPESYELTPDEIKQRTDEANAILKDHGDKEISGP